jgi:hypothetical protein
MRSGRHTMHGSYDRWTLILDSGPGRYRCELGKAVRSDMFISQSYDGMISVESELDIYVDVLAYNDTTTQRPLRSR